MEENRKVSKWTITRTLILLVALINQVLSVSGHAVLPIPDEDIESLVSTGFTLVMAVVNWWKNNSFTHAAITADAVMKRQRYNDREDKRLRHNREEENL